MPSSIAPPSPTVVAALAVLLSASTLAQARTVYHCVRAGSVSLSTAPEPGSRCTVKHFDDNVAKVPNLWGRLGVVQGALYERQENGRTVYSTRNLPGSTRVLGFTVQTPMGSTAHLGLGAIGTPQLDRYAAQFKAAAKANGIDDAWLRAIAHAESGFDARALSPKGAQGVMQLMPEIAREYGVHDPYSAAESIAAGARHLKTLMRRYRNDLALVAAAYNAGVGSVTRYGGIPPYAETQAYVARVQALQLRYRSALDARTR